MPTMARLWIVTGVLVALGAVALVCNRQRSSHSVRRADFVGSHACASCHSTEAKSWKSSQHALAMQEARQPGAVLGRFDSASVTSAGVTSTFFRRDNGYFVNTDGEDGALHDFEIRWTLGVYPLQQYLVELTGGRVQALTIAWDARPT